MSTFKVSFFGTEKIEEKVNVLDEREFSKMSELAEAIINEDWSQSIFKNRYRCRENFIQADVVALDFDDGYPLTQAMQEFKDYEHIIITTKSHMKTKGDQPAVDRFRVVLRLSRTVTDANEYTRIMTNLLQKYPEADQKTRDAGRKWRAGGHVASQVKDEGMKVDVDYYNNTNSSQSTVQSSNLTPAQLMKKYGVTISRLKDETINFILSGAPDGNFNSALFEAAKDCRDKGIPEEDFIKMAGPGTKYGYFDKSDHASIKSVYSKNTDPFKSMRNLMLDSMVKDIMVESISDSSKCLLFDEQNDTFRFVDKASVRSAMGSSYFNGTYFPEKGYCAKFVYRPHETGKRLQVSEAGAVFNVYLAPKWRLSEPKLISMPEIYMLFFDNLTAGDTASYEYLLDWMANSLQGRNQTILVAIGEEGIGKGVLAQILEKLHGEQNFSVTSDIIFKKEFNSPIENKTLVHIDELSIKDNQIALNRLKAIINPSIQIEGKGKDQYVAENFASYYICSNNYDAIPLDRGQRRFSVIQLTDEKLCDSKLVKDLFSGDQQELIDSLLNEENILKLGHFLLSRKIDQKAMIKPFESERTKLIREKCLKDWEEWLLFEFLPKKFNVRPDNLFEYDTEIKPAILARFPQMKSAPGRDRIEDLIRRFPGVISIHRINNKRYVKILTDRPIRYNDGNGKLEIVHSAESSSISNSQILEMDFSEELADTATGS